MWHETDAERIILIVDLAYAKMPVDYDVQHATLPLPELNHEREAVLASIPFSGGLL